MTEPTPRNPNVDDGTADWSTVRITGNPHRDERDNLASQRDNRADTRDDSADRREVRADEREQEANAREQQANQRESADDATLRQVDNLVKANVESNDTMLRLVEGVRHDSFMREKKIDLLEAGLKQLHRIIVMVGVALAVLLVIAFINATNINNARRNAAVTAQTAHDSKATYALLLDCLNATGECGKANAAETKKLLNEIKLHDLTTIYCARLNPATVDPEAAGYLACVDRLYPGGPKLDKTP